jgi:CHAT domain-containing protein
VGELPPQVRQLVIVSDGELHRLPFEALRPAPEQPRLAERFEIAVVPSATLWLRLRSASVAPASDAALVFADPQLAPGAGGDMPIEALPWARREARAIARTLRLDASHVREGVAASEDFLKQTPLGRYAVLHLAAHARADEAFPDRSAVFLAPGSAAEDGWLQPQEIAALDFGGRLVVLSACDSATGFLLSGEGPLSLARAFFAGGASGVIATRWPLRDDDAAFVMERFYRALAMGVGPATALQRARQDAVNANRPAAVWAGLVLVGDGLRPPFRQAVSGPPFPGRAAIVFSAIVFLTLAAVRLRSRWRQ